MPSRYINEAIMFGFMNSIHIVYTTASGPIVRNIEEYNQAVKEIDVAGKISVINIEELSYNNNETTVSNDEALHVEDLMVNNSKK